MKIPAELEGLLYWTSQTMAAGLKVTIRSWHAKLLYSRKAKWKDTSIASQVNAK